MNFKKIGICFSFFLTTLALGEESSSLATKSEAESPLELQTPELHAESAPLQGQQGRQGRSPAFSPRGLKLDSGQKHKNKRSKPGLTNRILNDKGDYGTRAPREFHDSIPRSEYEHEGQKLEVDPD